MMHQLSFSHYIVLFSLFSQLSFAIEPLVQSSYGPVQGTARNDKTIDWLGLRFGAPPVGDLRFSAPVDPTPSPDNKTFVANQFGSVCVSTPSNPDDTTRSEDCLFLNIFAPQNATRNSNLPVYFFLQGGGFASNAAPNWNGSGLVIASGYNMIVVQPNYRVGLYGFLAGEEIKKGGSVNNGIKDQIKALEWVKKNIKEFGGNPNHVVIGGDSAGAASVMYLITAYGGRDDHLFVAAAAESQSFGTQLSIEQSQYQYDNFVIRTGCASEEDTLKCIRSLSPRDIALVNRVTPYPGAQSAPLYMYSPTIDNDLIPDYTYRLLNQGKFIRVPTIFGDDTNGGTSFAPRSTKDIGESNSWLKDQFPALKLDQLDKLNELYPPTNDAFPNSGPYWRQLSNVYGEMRYLCPGLFASAAYRKFGVPSWNYRYNVEDPGQMASGVGVPHVAEAQVIWGPDYVGGPASLADPQGFNRPIIPVVQAYWISFVRARDPNRFRWAGSPVWEIWGSGSGSEDWNRIKIQTGKTEMERVDEGQRTRCEYLHSIGVDIWQ
ncbi:alpha/beta-hydrolase [Aulographum hederae CBS 113979]|uniref:Carboxylic ester hydrolase n=1 Tax=Aulographum hederae CBS 113979 TaxID=1176131 RepID=A0A6G1GW15_9PEZI|nr:alpha/beta-hydrolase [Aulographum hederae CBS 113979]